MKTHKKSSEHLQAQVAEFAATQGPAEAKYLFKNLGSIAADDIKNLSVRSTDTTNTPGGPVDITVSKDEYLNRMRALSETKRDEIKDRANLIAAYAAFSDEVSDLRKHLPEDHFESPLYLGRGIASEAFRLSSESKEYVARIPLSGRGPAEAHTVERHLSGAVRAKGIPNLEQIVAASYEEGVTIAEFIPGKAVDNLSLYDAMAIPDSHMDQLVEAVVQADKSGIALDSNRLNFLYERGAGFGIIDYKATEQPLGPMNAIAQLQKTVDLTYIDKSIAKKLPPGAVPLEYYQVSAVLLFKLRQAVIATDRIGDDEKSNLGERITEAIDRNLEYLQAAGAEIPRLSIKQPRFPWLRRLVRS